MSRLPLILALIAAPLATTAQEAEPQTPEPVPEV